MVKKTSCLITGRPGCGKTSLIKEVLGQLRIKVGGFYTQELRHGGRRQGFEIITLDGKTAPLALVGFPSSYQVSKYGVDIKGLEEVGVKAIYEGMLYRDLVVIDEIGKMELFSEAFKQAVLAVLNSPKPLLGTIMFSPHPWADRIKAHPQVRVLFLDRSNRPQVFAEVSRWLRSVLSP